MPGEQCLPMTLRLIPDRSPGRAAHGVVVRPVDLAEKAPQLSARADHYQGLQLALTPDMAILWAGKPVNLPWFPRVMFYLGPSLQWFFMPIDWCIATPRILISACREALERSHDVAPPLLVVPPGAAGPQGTGLQFVDLRASAPLANVDWSRLGEALR